MEFWAGAGGRCFSGFSGPVGRKKRGDCLGGARGGVSRRGGLPPPRLLAEKLVRHVRLRFTAWSFRRGKGREEPFMGVRGA
jgi:hypothetical protein